MRLILYTILTAVILGDLYWWVKSHNAVRGRAVRVIIALFMVIQIGLVVWILGSRMLSEIGRPPRFLTALAFIWHLFVLPVSVLAGIAFKRGDSPPPDCSSNCAAITRREFLTSAAALTPLIITSGGGFLSLEQHSRFRIRTLVVTLRHLPRELENLRLAIVADMHVGTFSTPLLLERIVEVTRRLAVDVVLLPGDLINNSLADLSDALAVVDNLESKYGSYLCVGNHDLIDNGAEFVRRTKERASLLVGEGRTIDVRGYPLQILGLLWSRHHIDTSVETLARAIEPGTFPILMAHHPHAFDAAARLGIPLTVSGHTHGGQLMAAADLGFGPMMFRYWSGLYRQGESALIVSNGVGNWFPVRVNAPAEIVEVVLRTGV